MVAFMLKNINEALKKIWKLNNKTKLVPHIKSFKAY